nr:zinc finger, CCHC-type [Tanacetum cinerariifolium]
MKILISAFGCNLPKFSLSFVGYQRAPNTWKNDKPEFQLYLIEGTRDEVSDQHSYCFNVEDDPKTFDDAMKSQDVAFWKEAINDEIDSIMGNNTWVLNDLPPRCKPLGCKWIFKRNLKVNGTVEKFKARLVIQDFKQKSGIDYFDTYAPVARISTIRLLISMVSIYNLIIHQMDVKTTFLNRELEEEVYMNQPLGFIIPGNKNKVDLTKEFLSSRFSMKDIIEEDVIFGIRIKQESNVSTPLDTCEKLMPNRGLAVSQLGYTSNPGSQHWQAIQRVLKYLKKTMNYRLVYSGYPSMLEGYTDASWISNTEDNSSTSGWVFLLGGDAISWVSKKAGMYGGMMTLMAGVHDREEIIKVLIRYKGVTRLKKYSELSAAEAIQADCDVKATNIIMQGLPPEVYALVSTHKVAKELWERIQMLMQGTSLTKQERECKLYDAFDKFAYQKGETICDFYLRFSLLLNDMNMYNMKLEQFQVNTKFINTLPSEWSKFVTDVKLVRDLHTTNIDQLHAYLGQHEYHANDVRLMNERTSDPLALISQHQLNRTPYQHHQLLYHQSQSQQQATSYQSSPYATTYHNSQYVSQGSSSPCLSIFYPVNDTSSTVNHSAYMASAPQIEYAPIAYNPLEFSSPETGLVVSVFQKGDDPIDAINHMMSFLTSVVASRSCNKQSALNIF